jgi:riboflavin transporter FmnP
MRLSLLIKVSILAALSTLLMHLSFPIFPAHPYLRYDPSEVPALIATFALGPLAGMAVVLLKNSLYMLLHFAPSEFIGIPINTLAGWTLVGVAGHVYRLRKNKSIALVSLSLGVVAMTLVMIPANLVLLPVFQRFFMPSVATMPSEQMLAIILAVVTPFNIIKGSLTAFLTFLVYKRVSPLLKSQSEGEKSRLSKPL